MTEYIAKNLAIELMHQSSYLSDGDLLEVNGNLAKARIEAEPAADVVPVKILKAEIYKLKCQQDSKNQDYYTGYMSALSTVEGILAEMGKE